MANLEIVASFKTGFLAATCLAFAPGFVQTVLAQTPGTPAPRVQTANPIQTATTERALLNQYCVTCHNEKLKKDRFCGGHGADPRRRGHGQPGTRRGNLGTGCPQAACRDDAPVRHAAPEAGSSRVDDFLPRKRARQACGNESARARAASDEPYGIQERGARSARPRYRSFEISALGRFHPWLRQRGGGVVAFSGAAGRLHVSGRARSAASPLAM